MSILNCFREFLKTKGLFEKGSDDLFDDSSTNIVNLDSEIGNLRAETRCLVVVEKALELGNLLTKVQNLEEISCAKVSKVAAMKCKVSRRTTTKLVEGESVKLWSNY